MKKIFAYLFICILMFFSGCGQNDALDKEVSVNTNNEVDDQNFSIQHNAVYTKEGFYTFNIDMNIVLYIDKETKRVVPLCSKPNCTHDNAKCDAHFAYGESIYLYNGFLYVVERVGATGEIVLYKMNTDGSERTKLRTLYCTEEDDVDKGISLDFVIRGGYGYMVINKGGAIENSGITDEIVLYKVSLDSDNKKELLKIEGCEPRIIINNVEGDNIYISAIQRDQDNSNKYISDDYSYNIKEEEMIQIPQQDDQEFEGCYNGKLYYFYRDKEPGTMIDNKIAFYVSDMDGNNNKCLWSAENVMTTYIFRDEMYWYIKSIEDEKLIVLSKEGNEMCRIDANSANIGVVWSDMENILFVDARLEEYFLYNIKTGEKTSIEGDIMCLNE